MSLYDSIRANIDAGAVSERVEVNQRALIDKILARYASAGAVYRELLQNSNDAEADTAEIYFTTSESSGIVTQVVYRNNGMPFRGQDWSRLKKIAEGNPDVSKVGAFGVGAYTMFSICEEPLVISGDAALAFVWKGDALYTKTAPNKEAKSADNQQWTSFVLPSRDPYKLPDMTDFASFLCASLTFTKCLRLVRVLVNNVEKVTIIKTLVEEPRPVSTNAAHQNSSSSSSWWQLGNSAQVTTPRGTFSLENAADQAIMESVYRMTVMMDGDMASLDARFLSASVKTRIPSDMARRMERVTKKQPPKHVSIQVFLNAQSTDSKPTSNAQRVIASFSPKAGAGRIFIGFRTSQTTGLAAHVAAPFVPTVEREAMDLQDPTLRLFNTELLSMAGILMRLALEDTMYNVIDTNWKRNAQKRAKLELEYKSKAKTAATPAEKDADEDETVATEAESSSSGGMSLMGFAKFMARGVTKKIVSVVNQVATGDSAEYLHPVDPLPLFEEEQAAVVLMRSFCPQQSTPDPLVGTCIAQGFSQCLPNTAPPVLTRAGVVRGDEARLPHYGIETFVQDQVVRTVVFKNAEEYHTVIAPCRKLEVSDLINKLKSTVVENDERLVFLLKWWTKISRVEPLQAGMYQQTLKDAIRFNYNPAPQTSRVISLSDWIFYVERESLFCKKSLPVPETVVDLPLAEKLGDSVLSDSSLRGWFEVLPMEIWAEFISHHPCMTQGKAQHDQLRINALMALHKEFVMRSNVERPVFGGYLHQLLGQRRCIPFDGKDGEFVADRPSELYLSSAELKAFDGVEGSSFRKVASALKTAGIGDEFLLALGVRKSVSIDFLFSSLDTLQWKSDPKPLVEYLRSATLTNQDLQKLSRTQYLPAEGTKHERTFAPSELYVPNAELRIFPFLNLLHWPSETELSERSENGKFLVRLGMKTMPSLTQVLSYINGLFAVDEEDGAKKLDDEQHRLKCLDFLADRLGPHGIYKNEYSRMGTVGKKRYRFVPSTSVDPLEASTTKMKMEAQSPLHVYANQQCGIMGFPIVDPALQDRAKLYGSLFQCPHEPDTHVLLHQLANLVKQAKKLQKQKGADEELDARIEGSFAAIFNYLSHRSNDFSFSYMDQLKREEFIPCRSNNTIVWKRPDHVFFRSKKGESQMTEELFDMIEFSPFLAAAGVRQEATTADLFRLLLSDPTKVLETLGTEARYRALLRRIAANPPFRRITPDIADAPFLLAYTMKGDIKTKEEEKKSAEDSTSTYHLMKARDIYIIDNSFFGRMFPVPRAPHESDLEDFYHILGSEYISKSVDRRFEIVGKPQTESPLTNALKERILERAPLLVSPNITSRPLVDNANKVLTKDNLGIFQASSLMAVYSLNGVTRRNAVTCFSKRMLRGNMSAIYCVQDFDWYDCGFAVGDLILKRCQLEDAFYISSLLEAPVEQLRARGFPVDRILKPEPPPKPEPEPEPQSEPTVASIPASNGGVPPSAMAAANTSAAAAARSSTGATTPDLQEVDLSNDKPEPQKLPPPPAAGGASPAPQQQPSDAAGAGGDAGIHDILKQMFPDADKDYIFNRLGHKPSMDSVRSLADEMASGSYPKEDDETASVSSKASSALHDAPNSGKPKKKGLRSKLGKAFSGLRGSSFGGMQPPPISAGGSTMPGLGGGGPMGGGAPITAPPSSGGGPMGGAGAPIAGPPPSGGGPNNVKESTTPVSPATDAASFDNLERMLQNTVKQSTDVNKNGMQSQETNLTTSIPEGFDDREKCEFIPAHALKPHPGPRNTGMTSNGIRVFSSRYDASSEAFLNQNVTCVDSFGLVLEKLCDVYSLRKDAICIFHDPTGGTIAFNAGRALHMNVRFFHSLHFSQRKHWTGECFSYWYVTIAHEMAHHLVSAHNKEHGFYTESYVTIYLPKLAQLIGTLHTPALN